MAEYIDRDKAYNVLTDYYHHSTKIQHEALRDAISRIPSADVAPVKHGKWKWEMADNGWANHICSECGWTKNTDIHVYLDYNYCPVCGAMMEGE